MNSFIIGILYGFCIIKIVNIIKKHIIRKHVKHIVIQCRTPEELKEELTKAMKELKEEKEND